jgi:DNA helicase HerA-like ATPase
MALEPLLIAGAAGTGKTVTLQRLVEQVIRIDVPTLLADVKGDLSGLAAAGQEKAVFSERRQQLALSPWTCCRPLAPAMG